MFSPYKVGATALVAAAALLSPGPLSAQGGSQGSRPDPEMEAPEVVNLDLRGVEALDADEVRESIATGESSCNSALYRFTACLVTKSSAVYTRRYLDRAELAKDVLRIRVLYWRRGYRETQVDTLVRPQGRGVEVVIEVREGPPTTVGTVAVTGADSLLSRRRIGRLVALERGEPFSMAALDSSADNVRLALQEQGYANARVDTATTVDTAAHTAFVRINTVPGPLTTVGPLRVEGLDELSERTVRNSLTLREGDVFRSSELFRSQRNLYESGLFRRAEIRAEGEDSVKALTVTVTEADLQRVRLSAGFNTIDFAQMDGRFTHFNFFGGARRLTLQATLGNLLAGQLEDKFIFQQATDDNFLGESSPFLRPTWLLSAEVRQPWFRSPHNTLALSAFAHRRATPLVVVDRGQGATATFNREFTARGNASLSYRFETTRIEAGDVYFCVNFGVCDVSTIRTLTGTQRLSPALLIVSLDRSNDPLGATRGYIGRLELQHASDVTASNYHYTRAVVEGSTYRPFWRGTLAGRVRVGRTWPLGGSVRPAEAVPLFGDEVLHPRTRFYAGGSRSVRGFGEAQLGPRILTISPSRLRGEAVTDGGTTYRCPPEVPITQCSLASELEGGALRSQDFVARPLGSPAVAEASVEFRRPVWGPLSVALFVDGAVLPAGDDAFFTLADNFMAITPGFGVRYQSPVGPIRVDVGINPSQAEALPVFTQVEQDGVLRIVQVGADLPPAQRPLFRYDPYGEGESWWRKAMSRLVLHLSIGEAF